jgi:DNA-binding NarL/FixJ family response regulator
MSSALKVVLCATDTLARSLCEVTPSLSDIELRFCALEIDVILDLCRAYQPEILMIEKQGDMGMLTALLNELRAERSRTDVMIVAHEADPLHARFLLNEGVKGYLLVSSLYEDFATSLRLVAAGKTVLSPLVAQGLLTTGS